MEMVALLRRTDWTDIRNCSVTFGQLLNFFIQYRYSFQYLTSHGQTLPLTRGLTGKTPNSKPSLLLSKMPLNSADVRFHSGRQLSLLSFQWLRFRKTNQRSVQSHLRTFVQRQTPSQQKTSIPTLRTLSFTPDSITTPPYNSLSVHELCRCSQGRTSLEEKAAKTLSVVRFPLRRHFETGRFRH
jgi:hypothetical protein